MRTCNMLLVCAFAYAGSALADELENEAHTFSVAPAADRCRITGIGYEDGAVEVTCRTRDAVYRRIRNPDDASANWPDEDWRNARLGDPVICQLTQVFTGRQFYILIRTLRDCTLVVDQGSKGTK